MGSLVPFSDHLTASDAAANNRHRLKVFRKVLRCNDFEGMKVLDIGKPNYIGRQLRVRDNTTGDLNWSLRAPDFEYDVILCFEVFQHVMNPLLFAQGMYKLLAPGGTLWLSTPLLWIIPWFHGVENFTEYKKDRVRELLWYVGFKVIHYSWHNPWPFEFCFYGIRPPLRYLHNRFQLWGLTK